MLRRVTAAQLQFLEERFNALVNAVPLSFSLLTPSQLPEEPGVYVITALIAEEDHPYYVGRTKNLRQRLYTNHLMGALSNARLKKHLITSGECADISAAKQFIRANCAVRWVQQVGHRERGAIEGYVTGLLFPKHGIYEEH